MKTVTIKISDEDFEDMVRHLEQDRLGKILVAVHALVAIDGEKFENRLGGGVAKAALSIPNE